ALVQTAERAEDINVERAEAARREAEEKLKASGDSTGDSAAAQAALAWAKAQVEAAGQGRA
ncbi:MAG TPA: ATP synthase delta/epsilon chain alpha-helix domain-containing protein, partial [Terriglobia bacterium]|nr:ATP synthase delta/epsilon chain alpha-helix domain-containing protein [Terriglobia bacterium]